MGIGTVFIVSDVAFLISTCFNIREGRDGSIIHIVEKLSPLDCSKKVVSPWLFICSHIKKLSPLDFSFVNILKKLSPLHCSFVDILKNEVVEYNKEG